MVGSECKQPPFNYSFISSNNKLIHCSLQLEKHLGFRPGLKGSLEEILEAGKNQLHHKPPVNSPDAPVHFCNDHSAIPLDFSWAVDTIKAKFDQTTRK
jgi:hypothetical protein